MFVNIINSYRDVIAICDEGLLGKKFEEPLEQGESHAKQLDVKESFYKGKSGKNLSEQEALNLIKNFKREDATFNIVGKDSIAVALKAGIISEDSIGKIQGIPYALVLL